MHDKLFVRIPAQIIMNKELSHLTVAVYLFIALTKGLGHKQSFTLAHFCDFMHLERNSHIRSKLFSAIEELELIGRIKLLDGSGGATYEITDSFFDDKHFALIYLDEIDTILASTNKGVELLRILAYLRLKMKKGVYHTSYESLGRILSIDNKTIKKRCKQLEELHIVSHIPFSTSYHKRNKTIFVKLQIFADMLYENCQERALKRKEDLKQRKLTFKNNDDDDLW